MASDPGLDIHLRLHYDEAIGTHERLGVVLTNLADVVVDGRIPNQDLPTIFRNLAEREGIMARNWTAVRDGIFGIFDTDSIRVRNGAMATSVNVEEQQTLTRNQAKKKLTLNPPKGRQSGTQTKVPKTVEVTPPNPGLEGLSAAERTAIIKELRRVTKVLRKAKEDGDAAARSRARQAHQKLTIKLQQHKRLCRLEGEEPRTEAEEDFSLAERVTNHIRAHSQARQAVKAKGGPKHASKAELEAMERRQDKQLWEDLKLRQKQARRARAAVRMMAKNITEAPEQRTLSFLPTQRPLPDFTYETGGVTIKEEIIKSWEI